jgi:hypothetical protein
MVWAGPQVRHRIHPVHPTAKGMVFLALQASDASVGPDAAHLDAADLPILCLEADRDFPRWASEDAPELKVAHLLREHRKPPQDVRPTVVFAFRAQCLAQPRHLALGFALDVARELPRLVAAPGFQLGLRQWKLSQLELKLDRPVVGSGLQDESELEQAHS